MYYSAEEQQRGRGVGDYKLGKKNLLWLLVAKQGCEGMTLLNVASTVNLM